MVGIRLLDAVIVAGFTFMRALAYALVVAIVLIQILLVTLFLLI
jgi:hypothetical protein